MLADQPPRPANMLHIVAINQGRAPYSTELVAPSVVSLEQADRALDGGALPIDVRDWREFSRAHAAGALNVPLSSSNFEQYVGWLLPPGHDALLLVEDAAQALEAARRLAFVGLETRVAAALPASSWPAAGRPVADVPALAPAETHRRLTADGLHVLDVRAAGEWEDVRIDGSLHADFRLLDTRLDDLPIERDDAIAVVCAGGLRSSIGASLLRRAGFSRVWNVAGGMSAWRDAGLPTRTGKP